jgi:hypothetical protein
MKLRVVFIYGHVSGPYYVTTVGTWGLGWGDENLSADSCDGPCAGRMQDDFTSSTARGKYRAKQDHGMTDASVAPGFAVAG